MKHLRLFILFSLPVLQAVSCSNKTQNKKELPPGEKMGYVKPGSSYQDTLTIDYKAAVFYYPDSQQLEKIRSGMEKGVFEASMHEYDSQLRVSHKVLEKQWPAIRVVEAKKIRYLRFIKTDKHQLIIDLNEKGDAYGLIAFNMEKDPVQVDMMNADTQLYYYFSK